MCFLGALNGIVTTITEGASLRYNFIGFERFESTSWVAFEPFETGHTLEMYLGLLERF
jgi:hypothetical protein